MRQRITGFTIAFIVMCLVSCQWIPAGAAERKAPPYILDTERQCTIAIQTDTAQKTAGKKLAVYQVGLIDATSLSLSFVLSEPFKEAEVNLLAAQSAERKQVIEKLCEYVEKGSMNPVKVVTLSEQGNVKIEVPSGAYLICQAEEGETKIQPTLVSIPYVSESMDSWIYDIEIELKAMAESVPTGDRQNMGGYVGITIAAGLLLLLLILVRKRSKQE